MKDLSYCLLNPKKTFVPTQAQYTVFYPIIQTLPMVDNTGKNVQSCFQFINGQFKFYSLEEK